jgi:uncharacterized Tic20 family protein
MGQTKTSSNDRTSLGVGVHFLGLVSGFIVPALVYLFSDSDFTRKNAQNALNWQIFYFAAVSLFVVLALAFEGTAVEWFIFISIPVVLILIILDLTFCLWATIKALGGDKWKYPIAPRFV